MCARVSFFWPPHPVTLLDRWHPLALWLACQRLNMSMWALPPASTFIYKCKFKPSHLHAPAPRRLTVQDWFGRFPSVETAAKLAPDRLGHWQTITRRFKSSTATGSRGRKWQSLNVPIKKSFLWKPSRKLLPPYYFFHILMTCVSVDEPSSGLRGKWQASSDSRSDHFVNPHTLIWDWVWIVGKHSSCWRSLLICIFSGKEV